MRNLEENSIILGTFCKYSFIGILVLKKKKKSCNIRVVVPVVICDLKKLLEGNKLGQLLQRGYIWKNGETLHHADALSHLT